METILTEVCIIGSGPAGLAAINKFNNLSFKGRVLIVDEGRHQFKRYCPVDNGFHCSGCGGRCNVISGFGGSMHYGDAFKLSKFPSGHRLSEIIGQEKSNLLIEEAAEMLSGKILDFHLPNLRFQDFTIKNYPIANVASEFIKQRIDFLYSRLLDNDFCSVKLNTKAICINRTDCGFSVLCEDLVTKKIFKVESKYVLVATGRKGFFWWRKEIRKLNLSYNQPKISMGLRFECNKKILSSIGNQHPDFKTSIISEQYKFKTFCFCGGSNGGRIKFTDYGDYTLLDGHVYENEIKEFDSANFALLYQLNNVSTPLTFDEVENTILSKYKNLNKMFPGKPVVQGYSDFKERKNSGRDTESLFSTLDFIPSIQTYQVANLSDLFTVEVHAKYCEIFEKLFKHFCECSDIDFGYAINNVLVIGLELEGLWDELNLNANLETNIENLYAAGDCTGVAQGILQAMVGGLNVANDIYEKIEVFN